jgi:L-serine dehydratase
MQSIKQLYKIGFGPSSSHTIGPVLAAEIFKQRHPDARHFNVHLYGSLSATGKGHGTDVALKKVFLPHDIELEWHKKELPEHPNGMEFEAKDSSDQLMERWRVYSIGGGDLMDEQGVLNDGRIYPHHLFSDIMHWSKEEGRGIWEYVDEHEPEGIWDYLREVWQVMKDSITRGLDREGVLPGSIKLPRKAHNYYVKSQHSHGILMEQGLLSAFALAVSEENAAGGKIVASPTCGSSGVLPAVLFYMSRGEHLSEGRILKALATAGLIGNLVKRNASISGAEVGCQGEIGTACAMAAGAVAQLMGGSTGQIEYAAEMGFEHNLGLTCDPVEGYVQIPCIERNAIAAGKAIDCATYALFSDGGHKISFDDAVETMKETGKDIQSAYRETGMGGLAKKWRPFG